MSNYVHVTCRADSRAERPTETGSAKIWEER